MSVGAYGFLSKSRAIFGIGPIPENIFVHVLFTVMVILGIAFASAHAQQVRAQKLARRYLESLPISDSRLHPKELFDMLCVPSVVRVAPLAQSFRGDYEFFETKENCPSWLMRASAAYYFILKFTAVMIYFVLPVATTWVVGSALYKAGAMEPWLLWLGIIGIMALAQVTLRELADMVVTLEKLVSPGN